MSTLRKGKDLLSLLGNCFATSIMRISQKKNKKNTQEAHMLIQQVKNYRQNRIKLMGFACIREPPIHNPDEPAK